MKQAVRTSEEIAERGEQFYETTIRKRVKTSHPGEFLAIDTDSGAYEIGPDQMDVMMRAYEKNPSGRLYLLKVGEPNAFRMGMGGADFSRFTLNQAYITRPGLPQLPDGYGCHLEAG